MQYSSSAHHFFAVQDNQKSAGEQRAEKPPVPAFGGDLERLGGDEFTACIIESVVSGAFHKNK